MPDAIVPVPTTPTCPISCRSRGALPASDAAASANVEPSAAWAASTDAGWCSSSPVRADSASSPDTTDAAPRASTSASGPTG
jgi:hypothetical protein